MPTEKSRLKKLITFEATVESGDNGTQYGRAEQLNVLNDVFLYEDVEKFLYNISAYGEHETTEAVDERGNSYWIRNVKIECLPQ